MVPPVAHTQPGSTQGTATRIDQSPNSKVQFSQPEQYSGFKSVVDAAAQVTLSTHHVSGETRESGDVPRTPEMWSSQQGAARAPVDLSEWKGHRVLAKRGNHYYPAKIINIKNACDVVVRIDGAEGTTDLLYSNVFSSSKFDVISDAVPSAKQLVEGARVVVRLDKEQHMFVEGVVYERQGSPATQYLVRIIRETGQPAVINNDHWLLRPHLRLLQPPWWEDLEPHGQNPSLLSSAQHHYTTHKPTAYLPLSFQESPAPHLVSAVAPPHPLVATTYGTVTPPNHVTPPGSVAMTPLSAQSGSVGLSSGSEELRRRQVDDYDSDDDLRREDITFPTEGGEDII